MFFIRKLLSMYVIFCPHCSKELNWFETSVGNGSQTDHLKCVICNRFFINDLTLTETDAPRKRIEHFKKKGWDDEGYQGVPTSYFYKPK